MRCRSAPQNAKLLKINRCLHLPLPMIGNGMLTHTMRARIYARGRTITNLILKIGSIGLGIGKEHCFATLIVIALIWHLNADRSSANRASMIFITTSVYVVPYMDPSTWIVKAWPACHSCKSCSSCRFTVSADIINIIIKTLCFQVFGKANPQSRGYAESDRKNKNKNKRNREPGAPLLEPHHLTPDLNKPSPVARRSLVTSH